MCPGFWVHIITSPLFLIFNFLDFISLQLYSEFFHRFGQNYRFGLEIIYWLTSSLISLSAHSFSLLAVSKEMFFNSLVPFISLATMECEIPLSLAIRYPE